tara:strand:+ start:756 stop:950 length:195 start_codon:yes stop_codon:yes gene_type:complete
MTENPLDKQIQESAEKVVASLEHLLSMIGDYSNDRYYRCFVCKRKLSQHPERVFCLNRVQFDKD